VRVCERERERERGGLRAIAATLMAEEQIGRNKHGTTSSVGSPLCDETGRGAKSLRTDQAPGALRAHDGERTSERASERASERLPD